MTYAQAVITQTKDGRWKIFIQSDKQIERCLYGSLKEVMRELEDASTREWERRSI